MKAPQSFFWNSRNHVELWGSDSYDLIYTGAGAPAALGCCHSERARLRSEAVNFEWDPRKAAQNWRKHGVSFHEAATVFGDPLSMTYQDPDHSTSEQRFITIGMSSAERLLIVAHADRGENIRIISARKATRREWEQHEEKN